MRFRAVRLRAQVPGGEVGRDANFDDDLVIIRGANTVGKSLLLHSMLYGLGMDDLYATAAGNLTRAMSTSVDVGITRLPVLSSFVEVELTNAADEVITVRRLVKPAAGTPAMGTQLVRVWPMPALTASIPLAQRSGEHDYYVNRSGAATDEAGFHVFLHDFLRWSETPKVPTYGESYVPLYIQEVFGLAFVEQKRGWGGVVPQVPTKYGIIEPLRRAVEYSMRLDVLSIITRRRGLDEDIKDLESQERYVRGRLESAAGLVGGQVVLPALPRTGAKSSRRALEGVVLDEKPRLQVLSGNAWVDVDDRLDELFQARRGRAIRAVETISAGRGAEEQSQLEGSLRDAESQLADLSARVAALNDSEQMLDMQLGALHRRLGHVDEESRRYSQLGTLVRLGSMIAETTLHEGDCPTCRQSLLGVEAVEGDSLSVEETGVALSEERDTIVSLIEQAEKAVASLDVRRNAWAGQLSELRAQVRALREDLVTPQGQPSLADLQRGLTDENQIASLTRLQAQTVGDSDLWAATRKSLAEKVAERLELGPVELSPSDVRKMEQWQAALRAQLEAYGFESAAISDVSVDAAMKPVVEGFDIGFQNSASDGIRLRWAYLLSLLGIVRAFEGNHPGFLMLDEPGQQGVQSVALAELFRQCAEVATSGSQVFITTSESLETVRDWVPGDAYSVVDVGEQKLLQPLRES